MNEQEKTKESFQREKNEMLIWQIAGPVFLLCAFILCARQPVPYDLYVMSLLGLVFTVRWSFRGCFYSLVLLICLGIARHWMGGIDHFWRLGLESSIGCSLLITALAFEYSTLKLDSLFSQLNAGQDALSHAEEELSKTREEASQQQVSSLAKIDALQKDTEELAQEKASFEVLNDVLRKVTACHLDEKKSLEAHLIQDQRNLAQSYLEIESLKQELFIFKNQNSEQEKYVLLDELNQARLEKEQSHLVNEQLVRLHAKESMKAKDALEKLHELTSEKKNLQEDLRLALQQAEQSMEDLEHASDKKEKNQEALIQINSFEEEVYLLKEKLELAEIELSALKKTPEEMDVVRNQRDSLVSQLGRAQEKIHELAKLEPVYKQLRAQFEEKNRILHETRASLFNVDTELQTIKIEREQRSLQFNPVSNEMAHEFFELDKEISNLQMENEELENLVGSLIKKQSSPDGENSLAETLNKALSSVKRKKKVKPKDPDLLF